MQHAGGHDAQTRVYDVTTAKRHKNTFKGIVHAKKKFSPPFLNFFVEVNAEKDIWMDAWNQTAFSYYNGKEKTYLL